MRWAVDCRSAPTRMRGSPPSRRCGGWSTASGCAGELRGALTDSRGGVAAATLEAATSGGAAALGIAAGRIAPGQWADFAAVDLAGRLARRRSVRAALLDAIVFGAGNGVVAGTFVGGKWRAAD